MNPNLMKYSRGQQIIFVILACFIIGCFIIDWRINKFHSHKNHSFNPDSTTIIKIKNWMNEIQEAEDLKIDEYEDLISDLNSILIDCNSEIITQYIINTCLILITIKTLTKLK